MNKEKVLKPNFLTGKDPDMETWYSRDIELYKRIVDLSKEKDYHEKEVLRMMSTYRERHKGDPITDADLRAMIEKFLNEKNGTDYKPTI